MSKHTAEFATKVGDVQNQGGGAEITKEDFLGQFPDKEAVLGVYHQLIQREILELNLKILLQDSVAQNQAIESIVLQNEALGNLDYDLRKASDNPRDREYKELNFSDDREIQKRSVLKTILISTIAEIEKVIRQRDAEDIGYKKLCQNIKLTRLYILADVLSIEITPSAMREKYFGDCLENHKIFLSRLNSQLLSNRVTLIESCEELKEQIKGIITLLGDELVKQLFNTKLSEDLINSLNYQQKNLLKDYVAQQTQIQKVRVLLIESENIIRRVDYSNNEQLEKEKGQLKILEGTLSFLERIIPQFRVPQLPISAGEGSVELLQPAALNGTELSAPSEISGDKGKSSQAAASSANIYRPPVPSAAQDRGFRPFPQVPGGFRPFVPFQGGFPPFPLLNMGNQRQPIGLGRGNMNAASRDPRTPDIQEAAAQVRRQQRGMNDQPGPDIERPEAKRPSDDREYGPAKKPSADSGHGGQQP